jgi:threonine/homoserine/homoserine lactone efflux protein
VPALGEGTVVDFAVLAAFVPASLVIILSPGADTFLLLRYAIRGGRSAGFSAMLGILAGLSLISLLLISGIGLLVSQYPLALDVLTLAGIGVLVVLAAISARAAFKLLKDVSGPEGPATTDLAASFTAGEPFRMSLITNVTNPKVLIFYLAFFPQFLGTATSVVWQLSLLSVAFLVVTVIWLVPLVFAASAASAFFQRPKVAIAMEISVAGVFLLLAVLLAITASTTG